MKRFILFCAFAAWSILAYCQSNDSEKLYLKSGSVINGHIQIESDGSYKVTTSSGDVFYFLPSEVDKRAGSEMKNLGKKPLFKEIIASGAIEKHGNKLRFVDSKTYLAETDFTSLEGWKKYERMRNRGSWGRGLLYGGLGGMAIGAGLVGIANVARDTQANNSFGYSGIVFFLSGFVASVTGLCLTINSNRNLKIARDSYNADAGYTLNFGIQPNGVGFALNF